MGGDDAPAVIMAGMAISAGRHPDIRFQLHGNEALLAPRLAQDFSALKDVCEIHHTDKTISSEEQPGKALRHGRDSSMGKAIMAVREGNADAAVSAGNTGAMMALSKFMLSTLPGIERPAIATLIPTTDGDTVMLDLGANVDCNEDNLIEFAVMGAAFARTVLGIECPTVGLLNVGTEEKKGNAAVRGAWNVLRQAHPGMKFHGFVEGDGLAAGVVDVLVTDGFTGNVALKTAEGTVRMMTDFFRDAFRSSLLARVGFLLSARALRSVRQRLEPGRHNGALFLGLNGLVVKSHGGTDAGGFATAIDTAIDMARDKLCDRIASDMKEFSRLEPEGKRDDQAESVAQ